MNIKLFEGQFNKSEALDLINQMVQIKIKFHEDKINQSLSEEEIKQRETRIKQLQKEFADFRTNFSRMDSKVSLCSSVMIE